MALFKIFKGNSSNLPGTKKEGNAYFTIDEGDFYIDISESERKQLNADRANRVEFRDLKINQNQISLRDFKYTADTCKLEGINIDCGEWEEYWMNQDNCCFEAGTQILVDLSGTTRNIEDMKPGDIAVAYDIQKEVNYLAMVKDTHIKYDTTDIAEIVFSNGSKLTMNAYHPIYTTTGWHSLTNYKNYDILLLGDICRTENGWSEIVNINRYKSSNNITMYSLDLIDIDETNDNDVNDNFFANGIVVHNADCPA